MADVHHVGETPTIQITLNEDISSILTHSWYVEKPDETEFILTGSEVSIDNDASGIVSTVCDKTQWDIAGWYKIHVYIEFSDNTEYYSDKVEHLVKDLYT